MSRPAPQFDSGNRFQVTQVKAGRQGFANLIYVVNSLQSSDAVVVDPGWALETILNLLTMRSLVLRGIVLTHSHKDHTAAAATLSEQTGVPVYGSPNCLASIGVPASRKHVIYETSNLRIGNCSVRALKTPGHTSCSISYLIGDYLFPGDTLFIEGCGLVTTPGGNAEELFSTCQMLKRVIPDGVRVFPGHEYKCPVGLTFAEVKARNIYLQINDKDTFSTFCNRPRRGRTPPAVGTVPEMPAEIRDFHLSEIDVPFKKAI